MKHILLVILFILIVGVIGVMFLKPRNPMSSEPVRPTATPVPTTSTSGTQTRTRIGIEEARSETLSPSQDYLLLAYVIKIEPEPYCPPGVMCKVSLPAHIIVSATEKKWEPYQPSKKYDDLNLFTENPEQFQVGHWYDFVITSDPKTGLLSPSIVSFTESHEVIED